MWDIHSHILLALHSRVQMTVRCAKRWGTRQRSVLILISHLKRPATNAGLQAIGQPSVLGDAGPLGLRLQLPFKWMD